MNQLPFSRENLFKAFFFSAFLFLIYQLLRILAAFVGPLLSAITLVMIFHPIHRYVRRKSGKRENMAAGVSTALILLIVIVPALFFLWLVTKQAAVAYPLAQEWVMSVQTDVEPASTNMVLSAINKVKAVVESFLSSWQIDSKDVFLKTVEQLSNSLSTLGTWLVKNAAFMMLNLFVMGFALFFLFRDGERIVRRVMDLVPMESSHKEHILERLNQTLTAVVRGSFITAVTQGILAGIGFAVVGIQFSVLLGFCTVFLALVPFVGAAVAWLPASIYFFATGSLWKGVFLLIWGAGVVSLADNFLKPIIIGEKANLPIFLLFFGILGGLQVYGVLGGLIGPLVITSVLAFSKIYREEMNHPVPPADDIPPKP